MKKILLSMLIPIAGLIGLYSCQQEIESPELEPTEVVDSEFLAAKTKIAEMGFDVTDLTDEGDYYVVEGDIGIEKSSLKEHSDLDTKARYYGESYKVHVPRNGTQRTIKVSADQSLGTISKRSNGTNRTEKLL